MDIHATSTIHLGHSGCSGRTVPKALVGASDGKFYIVGTCDTCRGTTWTDINDLWLATYGKTQEGGN